MFAEFSTLTFAASRAVLCVAFFVCTHNTIARAHTHRHTPQLVALAVAVAADQAANYAIYAVSLCTCLCVIKYLWRVQAIQIVYNLNSTLQSERANTH